MRTFRLFVSSPGDADVERRRTERVVGRLNGEFAGLARLATVRWETEFYQAHETFQTQIPAAADCDIVLGILRWKLGTELPPDFSDRLADGSSYPSGTAYELLTSIERRRIGAELPDVFVFRFAESPSIRVDGADRERTERDWAALRAFFERWFVTAQGHFVAALNGYASEDHFEAQLETLLRKWLAEKVAGGGVVAWPKTKGSPFRGLSVFGAKHAPVFFGRTADIRRASDLWRDHAARGVPYLLLVGASGAGKSSLARAGLIARITTPGVVKEVDVWRVAVMRPADSPEGPFASLAAALLQNEAMLPADEEGRGPALPEIIEGDFATASELAAVLAHADASAVRPIAGALARVGEAVRAAEHFQRQVRCDLLLLVDQLDELFAPSLDGDVRRRFAMLLQVLVDSGRVWVLATLRADLYAAMLDVEGLKALKDVGASYDLAPPGAAELAEIVREPATAAGLRFETDPGGRERLDERLLREADRSDMLPLVQLALSRLWEVRETRGDDTVLPWSAFERLGGVKGIIADAGETALANLGEPEKGQLAPLIRRLAELAPTQGGTAAAPTVRAVPLAEAAPDPTARRLLDALVSARLLTLASDAASGGTGDGVASSVRFAHQRVLNDWPRAATIVADSADFYRIRDEVEGQRRRWAAGGRRGDLLLARGLPLAEARTMVAKYAPELSPDTHAFINASRRRANRAQMFGWAAAAIFALLAAGAFVAARVALDQRAAAETARRAEEVQRKEADRQKRIAERNFTAAKRTVDGLMFNIAQGLKGVAGIRIETIRRILETVRKTVDLLQEAAPGDPEVLRLRAGMLTNFGDTYLSAGALREAVAALEESLTIVRRLARAYPGDLQLQRDVYVGLDRIGIVKQQAGDEAGALVAYRDALVVARDIAAKTPDSMRAQRDVSLALYNVGILEQERGDAASATRSFEQSLAISRKLAARDPQDTDVQRDLSVGLSSIAIMMKLRGDLSGALASFRESLAVARALAARDPGDQNRQSSVSIVLSNIGDVMLALADRKGALEAFRESLDIVRKLSAQDPGNAEYQDAVAQGLTKIGTVKRESGDLPGALADYREGLGILRKLAELDASKAVAQAAVGAALATVGDIELQAGDLPAAKEAFLESLVIRRRLVASQPDNREFQAALGESLSRIGTIARQSNDPPGALAAFEESLAIARRLVIWNPGSVEAQWTLVTSLTMAGEASKDPLPHYREALALAKALDSAGKLSPLRKPAIADLEGRIRRLEQR